VAAVGEDFEVEEDAAAVVVDFEEAEVEIVILWWTSREELPAPMLLALTTPTHGAKRWMLRQVIFSTIHVMYPNRTFSEIMYWKHNLDRPIRKEVKRLPIITTTESICD